jgi:hypothetical protein
LERQPLAALWTGQRRDFKQNIVVRLSIEVRVMVLGLLSSAMSER